MFDDSWLTAVALQPLQARYAFRIAALWYSLRVRDVRLTVLKYPVRSTHEVRQKYFLTAPSEDARTRVNAAYKFWWIWNKFQGNIP